MHIVLTLDNGYVMPLIVLLSSICKNNVGDIFFHIVVDQKFTQENERKIKRLIFSYSQNVVFYRIDSDNINYLPTFKENQPKHISLAAYFRLFLQKILPENIDKIIYLDCDIIVCGSLQGLWNIDMESYSIAGVPDMYEGDIYKYNYLKYKQSYGYFNSGVLLINLKYWREHNLIEQFLDFAQKYPERVIFHDQDILNSVLKDSKKHLPLKYNVQSGFLYRSVHISWEYEDELREAILHPVIVHYTTKYKPWYTNCDHPWKDLWIDYYRKTEYGAIRLKKMKEPFSFILLMKNVLYFLGLMKKEELYIDEKENVDQFA